MALHLRHILNHRREGRLEEEEAWGPEQSKKFEDTLIDVQKAVGKHAEGVHHVPWMSRDVSWRWCCATELSLFFHISYHRAREITLRSRWRLGKLLGSSLYTVDGISVLLLPSPVKGFKRYCS